MTDENGRLPEVTGVPLTVLIEWHEEVLEMLKHTAKGFSEKDLLKKVPYEGGFSTIRWGSGICLIITAITRRIFRLA